MPQLAPFVLWFPMFIIMFLPFILIMNINPIKCTECKCISSMLYAGPWSSSKPHSQMQFLSMLKISTLTFKYGHMMENLFKVKIYMLLFSL